jgi:hypothetical protein
MNWIVREWAPRWSHVSSYLDDGHYKTGDIMELAHVHSEVLELILFGFFQHQLGALADGIDAAQITGGVECWVGGFGERDVWEAGRPRAVWSGARRS